MVRRYFLSLLLLTLTPRPILDIFDVGVLATTASTLISVLTFNYIIPLFLPPPSSSPSFFAKLRVLSTRTLRIQAYSLFFCCIVLLAAMIPFMLFFATREAVVRAFVGTLELPKEVVDKVSAASGSTPVYSKIDYSMSLLSLFLLFTFTNVRARSQTSSHLPMVLTLLHLYRGGCLAQSRQGGARCCHC